ncbi:MAG TPA: hypothetical protein VGF17_07935 [Phytomonospora sp.]
MNFLDLPLKSRRAAFAKMDAADKAKGTKAPVKRSGAKKSAPARKAPGSSGAPKGKTGQLSADYLKSGTPSEKDVQTMIANYRAMHGKDPSPAQLTKLRRKRR